MLVKYLTFSSLSCQQESRALMTFAVDSQKRRVMMSSTKGSFSVQEVRKSRFWHCSETLKLVISAPSDVILQHLFPITAAEMYSSQSESIREDIPVLQRLCPATIFQKPLMKMLNSLILYCIFMYTISSVCKKIWATASAIFASVQLYSSCAVGVVRAFCGRWWTSVHLCDSLHEPQKRGRINSNRFIEIHRFFFFFA